MAVTYDNTMKAARMTATRDAVANGTLEIGTAGMAAVLVTFGLDAAGGAISNGIWTLAFDATTVAATAGGTAAAARIKNSGGTSRITGLTVGTSGTDIIVDNTTIANGQNVTLNGDQTITHAA
jgi:hypothetical protein